MLVILNRAAGSVGAKTEQRNDEISDLFAVHGVKARIVHCDQHTALEDLTAAAKDDPDEVVVGGGGDGTISAVAGTLVGTGKTLGVLPLGTLNHFAKDLGIPLDLGGAVQTIARGQVKEVDVAEVNGHVFINNSSLGIYPHIVSNREAQQERLGRGKLPSALWATLHAFRRFPFLDLRVNVDGQQLRRRTAFLFVGNNRYEIAGFKLGQRARLDTGKLGLYLAHRTGRLGLFRLGWNALRGRLHQEDDFESFLVEEATIEARKPRVLVAKDGEVEPLATPLHYRIRPRALRVMVPAESSS
jgi:diacylglycerol kinase family enzyme